MRSRSPGAWLRSDSPTSTNGSRAAATGPRGRRRRLWPAGVLLLMVLAYLGVALSFGRGFSSDLVMPSPPRQGVAVVVVPEELGADARTMAAAVLVLPDRSLTDADGRLTKAIRIEVDPTVTRGTVDFPAGRIPSPAKIAVPVVGAVQRYPFDSYAVDAAVRAVVTVEDESTTVPLTLTVGGAISGWDLGGLTANPPVDGTAQIRGDVSRAASTVFIALLLILMMAAMATIAALVVRAVLRGSLPLELAVASWLMTMLFALLPLRSFMPGSPPIGSWMDILVFFWVELTLGVCVVVTAVSLLLRKRGEQIEPEATSP